MEPGKILAAQQNSLYLLKLIGDVRVTLCAGLNTYIESLFSGEPPSAVYVDMLETEGVDSTTLGLLAKMGIYCRDILHKKPKIFCTDPGLLRTLETMSLDELFDMVSEAPQVEAPTTELECEEVSEDQVRQHVLEAHKMLVELDPEKWGDFVDLIRVLENHNSIPSKKSD